MRLQPVLGVILAIIATLAVSCGAAPHKQPLTYTPERLQQVQIYKPGVVALRERFPELENAIQTKDWVDVQSFIHGPLGELRSRMNRLANLLLPNDKAQANNFAQDLYSHLERLDTAAQANNQVLAGKEYRSALDDFEGFLNLTPDVE